jgi:hypothetical protein
MAAATTLHPRWPTLFITGGVNQLIEGWLNKKITLDTHALAAECARLCGRVLSSANE